MTTALCPICGTPETSTRCCWPMPSSPDSFWPAFDEDLFDCEIDIERRVGPGPFDVHGLAQAIGLSRTAVWIYIRRGHVPLPARYELEVGDRSGVAQEQGVWTSQQAARALWWKGRLAMKGCRKKAAKVA